MSDLIQYFLMTYFCKDELSHGILYSFAQPNERYFFNMTNSSRIEHKPDNPERNMYFTTTFLGLYRRINFHILQFSTEPFEKVFIGMGSKPVIAILTQRTEVNLSDHYSMDVILTIHRYQVFPSRDISISINENPRSKENFNTIRLLEIPTSSDVYFDLY